MRIGLGMVAVVRGNYAPDKLLRQMYNSQKQDWTLGQIVKVGFMQLRVISGKISTPGNGRPDEYALENVAGTKFYRFTPHNGCYRVDSRNEALNGAANY